MHRVHSIFYALSSWHVEKQLFFRISTDAIVRGFSSTEKTLESTVKNFSLNAWFENTHEHDISNGIFGRVGGRFFFLASNARNYAPAPRASSERSTS